MFQVILTLIILSTTIIPVFAQSNQSETLTISTYYPSPYGVYRNLEVKNGLSIGDITKGPVGDMNNLKPGQLYINNSVILNSLPNNPPGGKAGQLIYVGPQKMFRFFDGSSWIDVANSNEVIIIPPSGSCPPGYARINHWVAATIGGDCQSAYCYSIHPTLFACTCADDTCSTPAQWSDVAPSCNYVHRYVMGCSYMNMASGSATSFDKSACMKY